MNVADGDQTITGGDGPGAAGPLIRAFVEGDRGRLDAALHPDVEVHLSAFVDPDLWLVRDCIFDGSGAPVDMFWQAASYDSNQLPGPVTTDQTAQ